MYMCVYIYIYVYGYSIRYTHRLIDTEISHRITYDTI